MNTINIEVCEFRAISKKGTVGDCSFGYRVYDNYGKNYDNNFESIEAVYDYLNEDLEGAINQFDEFSDIDFENAIIMINDEIVKSPNK
jgi:hypothetical protein